MRGDLIFVLSLTKKAKKMKVSITTDRNNNRQITIEESNTEFVNHPLSWAGCSEYDTNEEVLAEAAALVAQMEEADEEAKG